MIYHLFILLIVNVGVLGKKKKGDKKVSNCEVEEFLKRPGTSCTKKLKKGSVCKNVSVCGGGIESDEVKCICLKSKGVCKWRGGTEWNCPAPPSTKVVQTTTNAPTTTTTMATTTTQAPTTTTQPPSTTQKATTRPRIMVGDVAMPQIVSMRDEGSWDTSTCDPTSCLNGGRCVVDFGNSNGFVCECPEGYGGDNCRELECTIIRVSSAWATTQIGRDNDGMLNDDRNRAQCFHVIDESAAGNLVQELTAKKTDLFSVREDVFDLATSQQSGYVGDIFPVVENPQCTDDQSTEIFFFDGLYKFDSINLDNYLGTARQTACDDELNEHSIIHKSRSITILFRPNQEFYDAQSTYEFSVRNNVADVCQQGGDDCHAYASCNPSDSAPFYTCSCNAGYSGAGQHCVSDDDEILINELTLRLANIHTTMDSYNQVDTSPAAAFQVATGIRMMSIYSSLNLKVTTATSDVDSYMTAPLNGVDYSTTLPAHQNELSTLQVDLDQESTDRATADGEISGASGGAAPEGNFESTELTLDCCGISGCESGNMEVFYFPDASVNWHEALAACQALDARIPSICTTADMTTVVNAMNLGGSRTMWSSLNDLDVEGVWEDYNTNAIATFDGQNMVNGQHPWAGGEPNDAGGEDCGHLPYGGNLFNDYSCSGQYLKYMCVRDLGSGVAGGDVPENVGELITDVSDQAATNNGLISGMVTSFDNQMNPSTGSVYTGDMQTPTFTVPDVASCSTDIETRIAAYGTNTDPNDISTAESALNTAQTSNSADVQSQTTELSNKVNAVLEEQYDGFSSVLVTPTSTGVIAFTQENADTNGVHGAGIFTSSRAYASNPGFYLVSFSMKPEKDVETKIVLYLDSTEVATLHTSDYLNRSGRDVISMSTGIYIEEGEALTIQLVVGGLASPISYGTHNSFSAWLIFAPTPTVTL